MCDKPKQMKTYRISRPHTVNSLKELGLPQLVFPQDKLPVASLTGKKSVAVGGTFREVSPAKLLRNAGIVGTKTRGDGSALQLLQKRVYPDSSYLADYSPPCIYLPSDLVMLLVMRACLYCQTYEETIFGMQEQEQRDREKARAEGQ